jgi:hypothetical protein
MCSGGVSERALAPYGAPVQCGQQEVGGGARLKLRKQGRDALEVDGECFQQIGKILRAGS